MAKSFNLKEVLDKNKKQVFVIFMTLFLCLIRYLGFSDQYCSIISLIVISTSSWLFIEWVLESCSKIENIIILCGYIIRLILLIVDVYFYDLLFSGLDSVGFWNTAIARYQGEYAYYTNYPVLLNFLFLFLGPNKLLAQYFNVMLWELSIVIVAGIFKLLKMNIKGKIATLLLVCLAPIYMIETVSLLREPIIAFCVLFSLYLVLLWIKKGNLLFIVLSFVPILFGSWLHSGTISVAVPIVLLWMFYDRTTQKFKIQKHTYIIFVLFILVTIFLFSNTKTRILLFRYLPNFNGSFIDTINSYITQREFYLHGNSDYLRGMRINNIFDLLSNTLIRMVYFRISPMPFETTRITDYACFAMDSTIYIFYYILIAFSIKKRKIVMLFSFLALLFFDGFFSWAVINAGSAIRHRTKIFCIIAISIGDMLSEITQEEKKQVEHN